MGGMQTLTSPPPLNKNYIRGNQNYIAYRKSFIPHNHLDPPLLLSRIMKIKTASIYNSNFAGLANV